MNKAITRIMFSIICIVFLVSACSPSNTKITQSTGASSLPNNGAGLTLTPDPIVTSQPTIIPPIPTVFYDTGSTEVSPKDGMTMVFIPAGEFQMGAPEGVGRDNEHPQHLVKLDAYWIDQTEVTNAMYIKCVTDGGCRELQEKSSATRHEYYGNPEYSDFPVVNVDWVNAYIYCNWAGRSLPSEAQWEKAAKGLQDIRFPWGDEVPNNSTNFIAVGASDTSEVGSYPDGASSYGALDMVGNVWEWVEDVDTDYSPSNYDNPRFGGDPNTAIRMQRGGSWVNIEESTTTFRSSEPPQVDLSKLGEVGFRCSQDFGWANEFISGSVVDDSGEPVKAYQFEIYQLDIEKMNEIQFEWTDVLDQSAVQNFRIHVVSVETDENGSFSIPATGAGPWFLKKNGVDYSNPIADPNIGYAEELNYDVIIRGNGIIFDMTSVPMTEPYKLELIETINHIEGQLVDFLGQPVVNGIVSAINTDYLRIHGISDATGHFSIPVFAGEWQVFGVYFYPDSYTEGHRIMITVIGSEPLEPITLDGRPMNITTRN